MRIAAMTGLVAAAVLAAASAEAQQMSVWRMAQDQHFVIPTCVAPAKLVETRTATGRIVWRCAIPR